MSASPLKSVRNFDEVSIGIAEVDGEDRRGGAGAPNGSFEEGYAAGLQMVGDVRDGRGGEEAEVGGSWRRLIRPGLELPALLVQVDLLVSEREGLASLAELDGTHSEHALIERAGGLDVPHREDKVIQSVDLHVPASSPPCAYADNDGESCPRR